MNRIPRKGFVAAAAIALIAGLGAAGALAANDVLSPAEESKTVIDDAASQLGIESSELSAALEQALKNRIDAAVDAGRLTEAQATELKERIDSEELPLFGHGAMGRFGFHGHGVALAAAASYIGLTEAELREELADKTLAEVARDRGKSVSGLVQAMVSAVESEIDGAVADGKLTKEQAAAIKADLEARFESMVNREHPRGGFGHGLGPGGGPWAPRGPPMFHHGPGA